MGRFGVKAKVKDLQLYQGFAKLGPISPNHLPRATPHRQRLQERTMHAFQSRECSPPQKKRRKNIRRKTKTKTNKKNSMRPLQLGPAATSARCRSQGPPCARQGHLADDPKRPTRTGLGTVAPVSNGCGSKLNHKKTGPQMFVHVSSYRSGSIVSTDFDRPNLATWKLRRSIQRHVSSSVLTKTGLITLWSKSTPKWWVKGKL